MLAFKYMVADGLYGNSPAFLEAAEQGGGKVYFVSLPSESRGWLQRPVTPSKRYPSKGETRAKHVVRHTEKAPRAVEVLAKNLQDCFW
jgi:hypothetical protein